MIKFTIIKINQEGNTIWSDIFYDLGIYKFITYKN